MRERVIRNVLARYVEHDRSVRNKSGTFHPIPHFMLNDVVRYWRTMASDYASKMWERNKDGWGTRNIKPRFSRKLLFVWGLLASFSGELFKTTAMANASNDEEQATLLAELIREQTERTPLELLARVASHEAISGDTAKQVFDAYDRFLQMLSDAQTRKRLDSVAWDDAIDDPVYDELRTASQAFREGINKLFFEQHPQLPELIHLYGVF